MKNYNSKKQISEHLNKILGNELIAINQYFIHGKILNHQGFKKLGDIVYKESIDEMKHADILIDRILYLEETPNMLNYSDKIGVGNDPKSIFQNDLNLEIKAIADLQNAIKACHDAKDFNSKKILEDILSSEEKHYEFLEEQLHLIKTVGIENYLTTQI